MLSFANFDTARILRTARTYPAGYSYEGARAASSGSYDSIDISKAAGKDSFHQQLVSRVSQEVRTATTTGDVQELRRAVEAGEYTPDPARIAARLARFSEE